MNRRSKWIAMSFVVFCGMTARAGPSMTVKTPDGESVVVGLTPDTKIEEPHGAFGMKKKHFDITALVPGLNKGLAKK